MRIPVVLLIDVLLVVLFVVVGRASHQESVGPAGLLSTGWPFLLALVAGWLAARIWRAPLSLGRGVVVWLLCCAGGLLLRVVFTEQTAQLPFVIVAALTTAVFLIGWRALALVLRRARGGDAPLRRPVRG